MGKKTKSKARLDKYYYLAKEHGFRSRAAFKLIQLNKKFHFLESATVLLDLCAAPGGWCQVASKQMPISSIRIGIDLDPIKPIPGVKTFQADITTQRCRNLIQQEIKDIKADVVLNDGAPNVGGQWSKDSYSQTELVLFAIKLATEFLKEGGWFVTKVFRSSDYNSLIYVMRQLFGKVEATKPLASRTQAAEVFVVCSEYKAPRHIDPKLLDPKFALKQLEEEDEMKSNTVKSIKALFDQKKQRGGYNSESMYIKRSFKEFIECQNPYQFIFETNQILFDDDDSKEYIKLVKTPIDYETYFKDLKLLGKKEVQELIIWRNKIKMRSHKHQDKEEEHPKEVKEHNVEEEIDEELEKFQKQRKKRQEQEKKKQEKQEFKNKQQYIEEQEQVQDNDVEFDQEVFDYIQKNKIDIENLDENIEEEKKEETKEGEYDEYDLDELSEDDYIDMMNEDIEENKRLYEEEKGLNPRKKKKKEKQKEKEEIEFVEQEKEESDLEDLKGSDSEEEEGDNSSDYDEESDGIELEEEKSYEDEEDKKIGNVAFNNPLRKEKKVKKEGEPEKKEEKNEEENLSSDTDEEEEQNKKKKQKKEKEEKLLNKKTKRDEKKEDDKEGESSSSEDDGYDTDEKAEIRAIAKKMLRKKDRIDILNKTYNRYAFEEDERAPKWFIEEERQHNVPQKPVTKAEILAERNVLKKIVDRMPKKILEAKARKRNKLNKRLEKVKKKAEAISNQEEINEFSKVKQIEKLYKKELAKGKEKKKYIVSRAFTHNNRGKDGRNYKHVDRRLKKDKRAEKARDKRNKKFKRRRH